MQLHTDLLALPNTATGLYSINTRNLTHPMLYHAHQKSNRYSAFMYNCIYYGTEYIPERMALTRNQ